MALSNAIIALDKKKEAGLAQFVRIHRQLDTILDDEIQVLTHADLAAAKDAARRTARRANMIIIAVSFLALIMGLMGSFLIVNTVTRPVTELVAATEAVASGDLSRRIVIKSSDEIGVLGDSFNRMTEMLEKSTVSRDYVESIFQSMTEAILVVSDDGKIQSLNPAASQLLNYRADELINLPIDMVFPDEVKVEMLGVLAKKGDTQTIETTYQTKDGRTIPILFSCSVIKNPDGKSRGHICTAIDITERKRSEEALRRSEENYRLLVENANESILVIQDGMIKYANPNAIKVSGYTEQELMSKPFTAFIYPDDQEMVMDRFLRRMKG